MRNVNKMYGYCNFSHVIHEKIVEHCRYPLSVLELGCGNGGNLGKFTQSTVRVGIDPFDDNIDRALNRGNGVNYMLGDHEKLLDFGANEFDVAFTYSVLDHIEDFTVALDKLLVVAKEVILIEPIVEGEERQAYKDETRWWDITWYHNYQKYLEEHLLVYRIEECPMFDDGSGPLYHLIHIYAESVV